MKTTHSTFTLATHTVHQIDFDPKTFVEADLLWLPHHHKLSHAGRKRKAEHLAGRLAAFHALRQHHLHHIPDIGDSRQPLWPAGIYGSISHCGTTALAVMSREPVGIDLETVFSAAMCEEVAGSIITPEERTVLNASGLPFALALTLAFSAKESAFKAFSYSPDLAGQRVDLAWRQRGQDVVTLLTQALQPA